MAALLEAGDEAGAQAAAVTLVANVDAAISAGDVPAALRDELVAGVEQLLAILPEPEASPPPEDPDDKPGKGKGRDKDKDDEDGDEETTTGGEDD